MVSFDARYTTDMSRDNSFDRQRNFTDTVCIVMGTIMVPDEK